ELAVISMHAELAGRHPNRRARAALQGGPGRPHRLAPTLLAIEGIRALWRRDPSQRTLLHGKAATHEDLPFDVAVVEVLVVLVVPVVEPAHRCIAPVDDGHAVTIVEQRVAPDEHVAAAAGSALAQTKVPEVGIVGIDGDAASLTPLAAERGHLVHLIDERR